MSKKIKRFLLDMVLAVIICLILIVVFHVSEIIALIVSTSLSGMIIEIFYDNKEKKEEDK